jgi:pyruvate dehydrogenase E2 component (dihydrolipoamide acetyltransferase)
MGSNAVAMPRLGMTMQEGTIVDWPIPVGESVTKGEILLVIETEKAETEIEATASGILRHVYVEPGEILPCGALLAALTDTADEPFDAEAFAEAYVPPPGSEVEDAGAPSIPERKVADPSPAISGVRKPVAPAARALAKKLALDPERIPGTGPNGRVTRSDVEAFAATRDRLVPVEPGVALEVLREGSGPAVVLLPGFGTDISSFAMLTPGLTPDFEVIGVNPRGVSGSDAPELAVYEIGRAAEDVASVLEGPAHIVGASLGAAVAIELALRHADRVSSLTLLTPFVQARPRLLAFAEGWTRLAAEASKETIASVLASWLFGDALLGDEKARKRTLRGLAQTVRQVPAATLARTAAGLASWSGSRSADLALIEAPTLVLAGGADLLTPDAADVAASISGARLEVLEGAGHALAIDAAEEVGRLLRTHLQAASRERVGTG